MLKQIMLTHQRDAQYSLPEWRWSNTKPAQGGTTLVSSSKVRRREFLGRSSLVVVGTGVQERFKHWGADKVNHGVRSVAAWSATIGS